MNIASNNTAYVIVVNDDNSMTVTQKRRIVQKSKLVDDLWFLVLPEYNEHNMAEFTAVLEYLSPISHEYRIEILVCNEEMYSGYLKYTLPLDTKLTKEAGEVEIMLSFVCVELDDAGNSVQRSRKITSTKINIVPIAAWSDIIPDCALSALDQRIIKMDAQIKALSETSALINETKADNIMFNDESKELQLMSGNEPIGSKVILDNVGVDKDGLPVVDFGAVEKDPDSDDDSDDVIEF